MEAWLVLRVVDGNPVWREQGREWELKQVAAAAVAWEVGVGQVAEKLRENGCSSKRTKHITNLPLTLRLWLLVLGCGW